MLTDPMIAATSGRIDSRWERRYRWNPFIAVRAFTYWSYQFTVKRSQNVLRVVNVVCGANSVFRAPVFAELIATDPPYVIDDMYWLAEIVRRGMGRVAYAHDARSWTIDPHRFGDWYRQTVRWCWGQFQSIRGHRLGCPLQRDPRTRLGVRISWFDVAYLALLADFLPYMAELVVLPVLAFVLRGWIDPLWFGLFFVAGSVFWIAVAAVALRKPRLVVLAPVLIGLDLVYRVAMLHALLKTIAKPRVEAHAWTSPPRFVLERVASGD
jgi:cellulose synthase/poly-beta-1,6-N-acetylglucosamine synthase-like glycosyltransferase